MRAQTNKSTSHIGQIAGPLAIAALCMLGSTAFGQRRIIRQGGQGVLNQYLVHPILETNYINNAFDTSSPTWSKKITNGLLFYPIINGPGDLLNMKFTNFEWTPVLDPTEEENGTWTGASGLVVNPQTSSADDPFLHPFGGDWEFFLAPDQPYQSLAAPTTDSEYVGAAQLAAQQGYKVPSILGVEWDGGLVPPAFQAQPGDHACVFGRWIVDTGHDDFHTEIHPPGLLVAARPNPASPGDSTTATMLGRPYMMSQIFFDGKGVTGHLLEEIHKLDTFQSLQLEAHPLFLAKPFHGTQILNFKIRPPRARSNQQEQLQVSFSLTARTGVTVQLVDGGDDSVSVLVIMNDAQYHAPALPKKRSHIISWDDLQKLNSSAETAHLAATLLTIFNPVAEIISQQGILTDTYDSPAAPNLGPATTVLVSNLPGKTPVTVNDGQVYPVAGSMTVSWFNPSVLHNPGLFHKIGGGGGTNPQTASGKGG